MEIIPIKTVLYNGGISAGWWGMSWQRGKFFGGRNMTQMLIFRQLCHHLCTLPVYGLITCLCAITFNGAALSYSPISKYLLIISWS